MNIVNFIYAVTPEGRSVTFDVYLGGLVGVKAMIKILDFLDECRIGVKEVILCKGYCNSKVQEYLNDNHMEYVIIVKGTPDVFGETIRMYGNEIKTNTEYLI